MMMMMMMIMMMIIIIIIIITVESTLTNYFLTVAIYYLNTINFKLLKMKYIWHILSVTEIVSLFVT